MTELAIYKRNRINNFQRILNTNISQLNLKLVNNIKIIKNSKFNAKGKQIRINNLINQFNNEVKSLKQDFNNKVSLIQAYSPPPIVINRNKKALHIGINYTGTENELFGCINDANSIQDRLVQQGFNSITILTDLTAVNATKVNILNELTKLLNESQAGDLLCVFYSGHGSYTYDRNNDENTGYDQMIVPCDF
jgi:hypothetical protein